LIQYKITGPILKDMVLTAAVFLDNNKSALDALNVFPVPDGDTGTNMSLTMMSAAKEVKAVSTVTVTSVANALSIGALKGARGNSGVILSQIFRGFAKGLEGEIESIEADKFAKAMELGSEAAYKAVMKPKEGTILTVAREMARAAREQAAAGGNMLHLIDGVLEQGEETLARTPEMLPILKEAGVVDAGGKGLLTIYRGFKMALDGEEVTAESLELSPEPKKEAPGKIAEGLQYTYCTEFFIKNVFEYVSLSDLDKFRDKLMRIGDCVLVVGDLQLIKVHVHTNMPGKVLQIALRLGELSGLKIDNMREQHNELSFEFEQESGPVEMKEMAVVAVAAGKGIQAILKDAGTDAIVEGGQTMNPSAEDIAKAVSAAPSNTVFILPNNKNIILAAESAADLTDKKLFVVPSKSIPQGISALLAFHPDYSAEENFERMKKAAVTVKTGQVTRAIRTTKVNGYDIKEGDYIGIFDGDIVCSGEDIESIPLALLNKIVKPDDCVISVFYGEDIPEDKASKFEKTVRGTFPDCDVELHYGGQPVYYYLFSVE